MKKVTVEFGGGLETLFDNQKKKTLTIQESIINVMDLIDHLSNYCSKKELFIKDSSIRPGILCLINDADWELEGTTDYIVQEGDVFTFLSTLHGG